VKRLACIFVALGLLLLQVLPVRATLRMTANSACCRKAGTCCEHPPAHRGKAGMDCAACLAACAGCAVVPVLDFFVGTLGQPALLRSHDEVGAERHDPPPLPPPR
jgi:hypothetical protein